MEKYLVTDNIYYVYPKNKLTEGFLVRVQHEYEGDTDLSYHGSPWYETFIEGVVVATGKTKIFGNQTYGWYNAETLIKQHFEDIAAVQKILFYS